MRLNDFIKKLQDIEAVSPGLEVEFDVRLSDRERKPKELGFESATAMRDSDGHFVLIRFVTDAL